MFFILKLKVFIKTFIFIKFMKGGLFSRYEIYLGTASTDTETIP